MHWKKDGNVYQLHFSYYNKLYKNIETKYNKNQQNQQQDKTRLKEN